MSWIRFPRRTHQFRQPKSDPRNHTKQNAKLHEIRIERSRPVCEIADPKSLLRPFWRFQSHQRLLDARFSILMV